MKLSCVLFYYCCFSNEIHSICLILFELCYEKAYMSHVMRKLVFMVSNQVIHKPAYTVSEKARSFKFQM